MRCPYPVLGNGTCFPRQHFRIEIDPQSLAECRQDRFRIRQELSRFQHRRILIARLEFLEELDQTVVACIPQGRL